MLLLEQLKALSEVILLLDASGPMTEKALTLLVYMPGVVEAIVGEVVADGRDNAGEPCKRTKVKLKGKLVGACVEQYVGHLRHIQAVKVVVIANVVRAIAIPQGAQRLVKYLGADHRQAGEVLGDASARQRHEGLLSTLLLA